MEVMYSFETGDFDKSFTGFSGEVSDLKNLINLENTPINMKKRVKSIIGKQDDSFDALNIKGIYDKRMSDLSLSEYKIILLIKTILLEPKVIVLNLYDLGFTDKMKSRIIRFIKTINATYRINFIIITNDFVFLSKITNNIIIMKSNIIKYKGELLVALRDELLPKPPIIEFIDCANKKGAKLDYTLDHKELLKGIYRSVF